MKAIGLDRFGGPEVLHLVELPTPQPGPGEVRIRVRAAGVNPTDATFRSGGRAAQLSERPAPYVPGMDLAGVIDAVGPRADGPEANDPAAASGLAVGDEVVALVIPFGEHGGAYAEQLVVDARSVVMAPVGADPAASATLLLNAVTADLALDAIDAAPGSAIAVTGAVGGVGGYAVQLAAHRGLHVIADASDADHDAVLGFGATEIAPRGAGFADAVRARHPEGVAGVIDAAGLVDAALPAVADGGVIAELKGQQPTLVRGVSLAAISSFGSVTDTARLDRLARLAEQGVLSLRVADILPAAQAPAAHRRLEAGGVRGRLVLSFED